MISQRDQLEEMAVGLETAPDADLHLAPADPEEVAAILRYASDNELAVQVLGGGSHSGYGSPPRPDIVMSTERLAHVQAWEPDDLTVVVEAGAGVATLEEMLAEENQTAVLPEVPGSSTIGGTIAAGVSSLRRGRLFATRERVLEATVVTGDGRIVRSGGRVVKNVTGYDLHRLHVGAFGSLGVIVSVCLKLWPVPPAAATVTVDDLDQASLAVRPLAVLEDNDGIRVFVWGTEDEVAAKVDRLGGSHVGGHDWPANPTGEFEWSLRVPPATTSEALTRLSEGWRHLAIHGVGEVRLATDGVAGWEDLRSWAESVGGHLVLTRAPDGAPSPDPWGTPPTGLKIQRALIGQFDPARVINPGRLPGGL